MITDRWARGSERQCRRLIGAYLQTAHLILGDSTRLSQPRSPNIPRRGLPGARHDGTRLRLEGFCSYYTMRLRVVHVEYLPLNGDQRSSRLMTRRSVSYLTLASAWKHANHCILPKACVSGRGKRSRLDWTRAHLV